MKMLLLLARSDEAAKKKNTWNQHETSMSVASERFSLLCGGEKRRPEIPLSSQASMSVGTIKEVLK